MSAQNNHNDQLWHFKMGKKLAYVNDVFIVSNQKVAQNSRFM